MALFLQEYDVVGKLEGSALAGGAKHRYCRQKAWRSGQPNERPGTLKYYVRV